MNGYAWIGLALLGNKIIDAGHARMGCGLRVSLGDFGYRERLTEKGAIEVARPL